MSLDETVPASDRKVCGIIMPISEIDGCSATHWAEVREILEDAIDAAGFEPRLVSEADAIGIIQNRIISNIYSNDMVVCDVSGKNPNVMFELGLRLAFDKPTIIIKDDKTQYSFDTSPIEHLGYRRDLRYKETVDFSSELTRRIVATYEHATSDPEYTTFLKHFGTFKVASVKSTEVSSTEAIAIELRAIRDDLKTLRAVPTSRPESATGKATRSGSVLCLGAGIDEEKGRSTLAAIEAMFPGKILQSGLIHNGHFHATFDALEASQSMEIAKLVRTTAPKARWLPRAIR